MPTHPAPPEIDGLDLAGVPELDLPDLEALNDYLSALIHDRKEEMRALAKAQLKAELRDLLKRAEAADIDPALILTPELRSHASTQPPARRKRRADAGAKRPPKYRDPEDPHRTWAGVGAKPKWVVKYLASGGQQDDLLIEHWTKNPRYKPPALAAV